jgi:adenylylsulfate kinase-like enzyme
MIYLFTGRPDSGKEALGKKLQFFIQTDKRNWRKSVFHISDDLSRILPSQNTTKEDRIFAIQRVYDIAKYLDSCGNDVVITLVSPYIELREKLKSECNVQEIYCHSKKLMSKESTLESDYEPPTSFYLDLDTSDSIDNTFNKLIKILN